MRTKEFAVIGLGRFGSNLAQTLESFGHHVLGIDSDPEIVQEHMDELTQVMTLDATNEDALRASGIADFETIIVAIGADFESNIMATVTLMELGAQRIIGRAQTSRQEAILRRIGVERVVRPEFDAGRRLAQELDLPGMLEHFVLGPGFRVAELHVPAAVVHKSLKQSNLRDDYGVSVVILKRGEQILVSPGDDVILQPDDILVILGPDNDVNQFCKLS